MCISGIKFSSNGEGQVTRIEKMGNVKFYLLIFPNVQETGTSMNIKESFPQITKKYITKTWYPIA